MSLYFDKTLALWLKSLIKRPCNYFLVLYNSLFYTQLTFIFHIQTNIYIHLLQY